jgi:hypothetical protein
MKGNKDTKINLHNLTKYFRQSLIDSERLSPADKDILPFIGIGKTKQTGEYVAVLKQCWLTGQIDSKITQHIIDVKSKKADKKLFSVEVLLIPRIDILASIGGRSNQNKKQVLIPILTLAKLDINGTLTPSDKAPWIPREWLAPSQSSDISISDIITVDEYVTTNPFDGIDTWQGMIEYCDAMLMDALGVESDDEVGNKPSLFNIEISDQFSQSADFLIQIETPIKGAKEKILKSYDELIENGNFPKLYEHYGDSNDLKLRDCPDKTDCSSSVRKHLGQMTGEFSLSEKQRNALHYFFSAKQGDVLAINGPPGTGKTTLLRSVVADLWTNAAIEQTEPPVIVAASNNNQAVTNILESFAKVNEDGIDNSLEGRWLPEISSYGLYCCSASAKAKDKYHYFSDKNDTTMQGWQTRNFLDKASPYFLEKAASWIEIKDPTIKKIQDTLHKDLLSMKKVLHAGFSLYEENEQINKDFSEIYGSKESLVSQINEANKQLEGNKSRLTSVRRLHDEVLSLWDDRGFWVNLFIWLPPIRKAEYRKTQRFVIKHDLDIDAFDDKNIESWFAQLTKSLKQQIIELESKLKQYKSHFKQWKSTESNLINWIEIHKPEKQFAEGYYDEVVEIGDRVLRFKMFKLATHYWEAVWLQELKSFIDNNENEANSPRKIARRLRRYAKITPCMVSTFYMIPSLLTAYEMKDGTWKNIPLFEEIDLLIVDEAGQALPEVSAASFAFAKKAIIVGDTDQIEPVWSVPTGVDRSNLAAFDLLKDEAHYDEFWLESGLMASNGNVMRVAQRQTAYHQFKQLQRGLYLTEHRRCYDKIIAYCNDIIYQGLLEPKRGNPKQNVPWGEMSFIEVTSPSVKFGGSRGNVGEAKAIANWLANNFVSIVAYARSQDNALIQVDDAIVFQQSIGVVTPFSKQAQLIRQKSKDSNLPTFTVGTVHSFQGAEKLIVLFSSVYGINDKSVGKFYDVKPNMLNVAVSRAKDSFIVFGDPNVFGVDSSGSPSGILRNRLELKLL